MAAKSKLEKFKEEINELISIGVSIKSAWKIINRKIHEDGKISYNAFYNFVKKQIIT